NLSSSGLVGVVDRTAGTFGAGWGLSDVDQLAQDPTTGDVLWISGNGFSRIFPSTGGGRFADPSGDFGTLTENPTTGGVNYVAKDQTVWTFSGGTSPGRLLSKVDPHGLTEQFNYDASHNNRFSSIVNIDGAVTTFSYDSAGHLNAINEPGGRSL